MLPQSHAKAKRRDTRGRVGLRRRSGLGHLRRVRRGDSSGPFNLYSAEIEWDLSRGLAKGVGGVKGHGGVRQFFLDLLAAFSEIGFKLVDVSPRGDRVLATVDEHYVGRASDVEVTRRHYTVWTIPDGTVSAMCGYLDRREAPEATGVRW